MEIDYANDQIYCINDFIKIHDSSKTNASLETTYIESSGNINELIEKLKKRQILVLSGNTGVGKTRLGIELCRKLFTNANIICVYSNYLDSYQDIKNALDSTRMNYIFIDEGTRLKDFSSVISLINSLQHDVNIKIIVTTSLDHLN